MNKRWLNRLVVVGLVRGTGFLVSDEFDVG
jgi:hypothetical protein